MKTKDLRHLNRADLLDLLVRSREENEQLKKTIEEQQKEIASLKEELEDRTIRIQKAGTLAQASLELNHIFEDADAAAQQYLANLKRRMDAMDAPTSRNWKRNTVADHRKKKELEMPSTASLKKELAHEKYVQRYRNGLRGVIYILITAAALAVLIASLWLPVLRIYGDSMTPTLQEGDVIVALKNERWSQGKLVCFWYNNRILVKRAIAGPGDWVNIEEDGTVLVNGVALDEPYVSDLALGECDITLPYQVPENRVFVLGDHRSVSIDSRNSAVGAIPMEQIVGTVLIRIAPLNRFGFLN